MAENLLSQEAIEQMECSIENAANQGELRAPEFGLDGGLAPESASFDEQNPILARNIRQFSKYGPTIKSTIFAVLQALFVPAALAFLVWQLWPAFEVETLKGSIWRSLVMLIPALVLCFTLANLMRPKGTAEKYFGWSPLLCDGLLKTINNLIWINLPLKFIYVALATYQVGKWDDSLGRILFVSSMIALAYALRQTAKAVNQWRDELTGESKTWSAGIRRLALLMVVFMPVALGAMSAIGFHFTAVELSWRCVWTVLLSIAIALTTGLISRLLLITQFRIKLRQLARDSDGEINADESIDISEISGQVNRLLRATSLVVLVVVGWQIWAQVLPAINYLDEWELWHSAIVDDTGNKPWITLRHVLLAAGVVFITYVLSRNLPGLMEITFLDRLPLDKGGRYAISFVVRYVVGIVRLLCAFQMIGFSWTSVQWLAGGLILGLGFGLQEIFANLISGIIILIERPVRVGDLVTVNGVTGTVTQMQLRATTLKDLDYRELIVPNKRFITEDVMNWTLNDRLSRLVLPIGIAYGSDTDKTQKVLLEVARQHTLVMNDPAPEVGFKNFGDSTLDFELRVVIPTREEFQKTIHELNMAIDKAFREADIEIAFPQQDVHVRTLHGSLPVQPEPTPDRKQKSKRAVTPAAGVSEPPTDLMGGAFAIAENSKVEMSNEDLDLPDENWQPDEKVETNEIESAGVQLARQTSLDAGSSAGAQDRKPRQVSVKDLSLFKTDSDVEELPIVDLPTLRRQARSRRAG